MTRSEERTAESWDHYDRTKLFGAFLGAVGLVFLWTLGHTPWTFQTCAALPAIAAPAPASAATATSAVAAQPLLDIAVVEGEVTLAGTVRDDATKAALLETAASTFGAGNVAGELKVDAAVAPLDWRGHLPAVFAQLKLVAEKPGLMIDGAAATLTGTVTSDAEKELRAREIGRLLGQATTLTNKLEVK